MGLEPITSVELTDFQRLEILRDEEERLAEELTEVERQIRELLLTAARQQYLTSLSPYYTAQNTGEHSGQASCLDEGLQISVALRKVNDLFDRRRPPHLVRPRQVEGLAAGDAVQPRPVIGVLGQPGKGLERPEERLLQDVGGILAVSGHAASEAIDLLLDAGLQLELADPSESISYPDEIDVLAV